MGRTRKWAKIAIIVVWGLTVLGMFLLVSVLGFAMLSDNQLIQNVVMFNQISLLIGLLSLPSAFVGILGMINSGKKKYVVTNRCPNCKHLVDLSLTEEN